jgi:hypothetical protein
MNPLEQKINSFKNMSDKEISELTQYPKIGKLVTIVQVEALFMLAMEQGKAELASDTLKQLMQLKEEFYAEAKPEAKDLLNRKIGSPMTYEEKNEYVKQVKELLTNGVVSKEIPDYSKGFYVINLNEFHKYEKEVAAINEYALK